MGYSRELADRIRVVIGGRPDVEERAMFGGIAFLVNGNMSVGIVGELLCARLGRDGAQAALAEPHTRPMDFTGKPLSTMVYVEPDGLVRASELQAWVGRALAFAGTLPPKVARRKKA